MTAAPFAAHLTVHMSTHTEPPVLPEGTETLDQLRWRDGVWKAVSTEGGTFGAITRENTVASLKAAFDAASALPNGMGPAGNAVVFGIGDNTSLALEGILNALWPEGQPAPYVWVVDSEFSGAVSRYRVRMKLVGSDPATVVETGAEPLDTKLVIDGVPHQVVAVQIPFTRPVVPGPPSPGLPPQDPDHIQVRIQPPLPSTAPRSVEVDAPPAPTEYHLLAGTDNAFSADEVIATGLTNVLQIPAGTVPQGETRWFAFARPADLGPYTFAGINPGPNPTLNQINAWETGPELVIDGINCLLLQARIAYAANANGIYIKAE